MKNSNIYFKKIDFRYMGFQALFEKDLRLMKQKACVYLKEI